MNTTLNRISKIKSDQTFHIWDTTQDGRFPYPRIKGDKKRIRNKARRRHEKEMVRQEVRVI